MALNLDYAPVVVVDTAGLDDLEWRKYRQKGIGGSDVAAIMGQSSFRNILDVFHDKTTPVKEEKLSEEEQFRFDIGHAMEKPLSLAFGRRTGYEVVHDTNMYRHPLFPLLQANIDDSVITPEGKGGVEYKSTNSHNDVKWINGFPYEYELQIRMYMAVMNWNFWFIMGCWDNHPGCAPIYYVERDLELEELIINACADFWHNHVEQGVMPTYEAEADKVKQALIDFHRRQMREDAGYMVASDNLTVAAAQYFRLNERIAKREKWIRQLKEERDNYAIPLVEALGSDYAVGYSGELEFGYASRASRSCNWKDFKELHPQIYQQLVTENQSTWLYVKKAKNLPEELRLSA